MTVDSIPELPTLDTNEVSDKVREEMCIYFTEVYTFILKLLLSAKTTNFFIESNIDEEIRYCTSALDWLDSLKSKKPR